MINVDFLLTSNDSSFYAMHENGSFFMVFTADKEKDKYVIVDYSINDCPNFVILPATKSSVMNDISIKKAENYSVIFDAFSSQKEL